VRNPIRSMCVATLALGLCVVALAEESLEQKRDKKLKSEYLKKAAWITDYDKARAEAEKSGKLIFAFFSRSYAP